MYTQVRQINGQVCIVKDIKPPDTYTQHRVEMKPSRITGGVGMHNDREDTAVEAQMITNGQNGAGSLCKSTYK